MVDVYGNPYINGPCTAPSRNGPPTDKPSEWAPRYIPKSFTAHKPNSLYDKVGWARVYCHIEPSAATKTPGVQFSGNGPLQA
jgi:hypothetical protein